MRRFPGRSRAWAGIEKDMTELVATENPEEEELRRKKEELAALENELADLELEAAALLADTQAFLDTVTLANRILVDAIYVL